MRNGFFQSTTDFVFLCKFKLNSRLAIPQPDRTTQIAPPNNQKTLPLPPQDLFS